MFFMENNIKEKLRNDIFQIRKSLSDSELIDKNNKIKDIIYKMDLFKQASIILFYVSYRSEVNTHDMIKHCLSNGKKIIVPKVDLKKNKLLLSELSSWNHLEYGAYDILEPKLEYIKEVSIDSIDLMFIPGVVFDIFGNRIGHGKGYYDRLLRNPHQAISIGLAFEFQIVENIPAESHDIKVDKIVTENRILNCKKIM